MAFNGSGTFVRLYNWGNDAANAINITASRMDGEDNGFATGLSDCVTRDGQSPWTANLPAGGFKITGLGNGSGATDSAALGQVFQISNNLSEGTAATMRTNLGLGSISTQAASAVAITGGTIAGITGGLGIRSSGTGAFDLSIKNTENLTAGHALTVALNNADRTLTVAGTASVSGTNTGDQTITLTQDVTGSGTGSITCNIASGAVSNSKMVAMAAHTIKGNNTGGSAAPIDMTVAQALTLLGFTTSGIGANGSITLPGGLIVQWGNAGVITGNGSAAVTFPSAFPTNLWAIATAQSMGISHFNGGITGESTSGFTYYNNTGTNTTAAYWIAIGN